MQFIDGNNLFQLEIVSYQYPETLDDRYGSNWVVVKGQVETEGDVWEFLDPCLLAWEAQELATWFEALANHSNTTNVLRFIEPNVSFRSLSNNTLQLILAAEALPPGRRTAMKPGDTVKLQFMVQPAALQQAAQDLRLQLTRFPTRIPEGEH